MKRGGGDPGDKVSALRLGRANVCNGATSVEFGKGARRLGEGRLQIQRYFLISFNFLRKSSLKDQLGDKLLRLRGLIRLES